MPWCACARVGGGFAPQRSPPSVSCGALHSSPSESRSNLALSLGTEWFRVRWGGVGVSGNPVRRWNERSSEGTGVRTRAELRHVGVGMLKVATPAPGAGEVTVKHGQATPSILGPSGPLGPSRAARARQSRAAARRRAPAARARGAPSSRPAGATWPHRPAAAPHPPPTPDTHSAKLTVRLADDALFEPTGQAGGNSNGRVPGACVCGKVGSHPGGPGGGGAGCCADCGCGGCGCGGAAGGAGGSAGSGGGGSAGGGGWRCTAPRPADCPTTVLGLGLGLGETAADASRARPHTIDFEENASSAVSPSVLGELSKNARGKSGW
eukprot:gene10937-biopygen21356